MQDLTIDGLLFDPQEYVAEPLRAIMEGKTCRMCRHCGKDSPHKARGSFYCFAIASNITSNGWLKVKSNQPACVRFTEKNL